LRLFKFNIFLLFLFILSCDRQKSEKGSLVLFDAYKEQVWPIKDTGFTGYASLNLFLQNLGYRTAENHKPYEEILPDLNSQTLFVLGVAMEARFTEEEIKNILDFIRRGGKLLVIAEHDNQYGSADFLRPLINAAGWEISNGHVVSESDSFPGTKGRWIRSSLPSGNEGPVLLCAAELTAMREKSCKVLLTSFSGKHIVAGLGNYGKGKIAVIGDSEFLWNADTGYRWKDHYLLAFSDNKTRDFIRDLFFSILPPLEDTSQSNDLFFSGKSLGSRRVFLYGNGGCFKNYSGFLTALNEAGISVFKYSEGMEITPGDRVIVITPLKKIPGNIVDEFLKSGKVVLFGDMYSSVKSYADSWDIFFKQVKIKPVFYPLNSIAEAYGVRFLPFFGVNFEENEHGNILYIPVFFNNKRLYLHRACAVELFNNKRNKDIYFENCRETFACRAGLGLNHPLKFKDPRDMGNPDFLIATDKVLAVGDSDIISDDFISDARRSGFLETIIDFLLKG